MVPPGRKKGNKIERSEDETAGLNVLNRLLTAKSRDASRQELKALRADAIAREAALLKTQATRITAKP